MPEEHLPTPDATPRLPRGTNTDAEYSSLDSAWSRDYFTARIDEIRIMLKERDRRYEQRFVSSQLAIDEKALEYRREVGATAEALRLQTEASDNNLLAHIVAQKESVATALASLKELLAEKDRAVVLAQAVQIAASNEFKESILARLETLNGHNAQIDTLTASFPSKELFYELRDKLHQTDAQASDNARSIAALANNPVDMQTFRLRIEALEARPPSLSLEDQGKLKADVIEVMRDVSRLHVDFHAQGNELQALKIAPTQFSPTEVGDMRRLLRAWLKADVTEELTDTEVKGLREVLAGKGVRTRRIGLLEAALITGIITIIVSLAVVLLIRLIG